MNTDRHPIPDAPDMPLADRVRHLEVKCAQMWDLLWWITLPAERRHGYEREGFTAPIQRFYEER